MYVLYLEVQAKQNELWASLWLVGALRAAQTSWMLANKELKFTKDTSAWARFWKVRQLQLAWLTNTAIEVWQTYAIPATKLELAILLTKLNPKLQPYMTSAVFANEKQMAPAQKVFRRYAVQAETYTWQCWGA